MDQPSCTRRDFLSSAAAGLAASAARPAAARPLRAAAPLRVDPRPRHALSPHLYMQFMEPLGVTDGSVAAAWDFPNHRWRPDVIEATRDLEPGMVRWGGVFCSYYRWRDGVGPWPERRPALNLVWGGVDTNHVGTAEFAGFCRQTGADPLICINFEADGRRFWDRDPWGAARSGDAAEAAAWVAYCNQPDHPLRREHGFPEPFGLRWWQIGNETSYDQRGFDLETCARKTVEFATAMRRADPEIQLIGWGDSGWAPRMIEVAGEHLQYLAFHHMFNPDWNLEESPLRGIDYRRDPAWTWERLMTAAAIHDQRIRDIRREVEGSGIRLALTECHFAFPGRNRCEVLSTWAAGVAYARMANVHERHGDILGIATLADFCGTRWQVNALMIPVPWGRAWLMPVGKVMRLYRHHGGEQAVGIQGGDPLLDVTASRTGERIFLHAVNTHRRRAVEADLEVIGRTVQAARAFEIAGDPLTEVMEDQPDAVRAVEKAVPVGEPWTFPPASVTALELDLASEEAGS